MDVSDILILGIILGVFLFYYLSKKIKSFKIKRMLAGAKRAEKDAIYLLIKEGFEIISIQEKRDIVTYIDEKSYPSYVKVDMVVKKKGKTYIVEVKTGQQTRATTALVRRQLLEYFLVFNPHGILLLDMEKKKIQTIQFEWGEKNNTWVCLTLAGLAGILMGMIIWKYIG